MENIAELLNKMKEADKETARLKEARKSKLTDKQKYIRGLVGRRK